jgi:hypothetical protein
MQSKHSNKNGITIYTTLQYKIRHGSAFIDPHQVVGIT